ncbi:ABC transporter substrate-binding protein [Pseudochelatococcus sp. B33]
MKKFAMGALSAMSLFVMSLFVMAPAGAIAQSVPAGYPAEYQQIIDAAKTENGLLVYSTTVASDFDPFIKLVRERYPFMKVETTDDSQLWEKYYAESAAGVRTADIIQASHPDQWIAFVERGQVDPYNSPESDELPDWTKPAPGVYSASADPMIRAYSRVYFEGKEPPMSVAEIVEALKSNPNLQNKITALDPAGNLMGLAVWNAWSKKVPDGWSLIEQLGTNIRPERGSGTMREKILTGEYAVAILISGATIPRFEQPAHKALSGWGYPKDGTPIITRNVAITKAAKSPNSARLFLDLMLTREGQIALSQGGMMPYRDDIAESDVKYGTYKSVVDAVGADKVIFISPVREVLVGLDESLASWNKAIGR